MSARSRRGLRERGPCGWRARTGRGNQPLARFTGDGEMVTSLACSFTNDHSETERAGGAEPMDCRLRAANARGARSATSGLPKIKRVRNRCFVVGFYLCEPCFLIQGDRLRHGRQSVQAHFAVPDSLRLVDDGMD